MPRIDRAPRLAMTVVVASGALAVCSLLISVDELTGASTPVDASVDTTPPQDGQEQRDSVSPEAALEAGLPAYAAAVLRDAPMLYLRLEEMTGPLAHAERGIDATYFGSVQPGVPGAFPGSRAIRLEGPP